MSETPTPEPVQDLPRTKEEAKPDIVDNLTVTHVGVPKSPKKKRTRSEKQLANDARLKQLAKEKAEALKAVKQQDKKVKTVEKHVEQSKIIEEAIEEDNTVAKFLIGAVIVAGVLLL